MLEQNRTKDILIGVMAIALVVVSAVWYAYRHSRNAQQTSPVLTSTEEVVLQQQIAEIISSKNESNCATLTNGNYRLACEQILSSPQGGRGSGILPQSSPTESMTEAQLKSLLQRSSQQPLPTIQLATTTP